jgi:FdhD protein
MISPADLDDFALGFSLTEGVARDATEIRALEVEEAEAGIRLVVTLTPERLAAFLASRRHRSMSGRTGCGHCSVEELADLPLATRVAGPVVRIEPSAVRRAITSLSASQPLNNAARAVHAAAWALPDGEVILVREDVRRHNALDKLIGVLIRLNVNADSGFVVVTSRLSFEMVEKAAVFGAGTAAAISAPTSLALDRARLQGMTLVAVARNDAHTVFIESEAAEALQA